MPSQHIMTSQYQKKLLYSIDCWPWLNVWCDDSLETSQYSLLVLANELSNLNWFDIYLTFDRNKKILYYHLGILETIINTCCTYMYMDCNDPEIYWQVDLNKIIDIKYMLFVYVSQHNYIFKLCHHRLRPSVFYSLVYMSVLFQVTC